MHLVNHSSTGAAPSKEVPMNYGELEYYRRGFPLSRTLGSSKKLKVEWFPNTTHKTESEPPELQVDVREALAPRNPVCPLRW